MACVKTHPSVRIKGTENNYNPVQCFDPLCHEKSPHMHCPFCTKNEVYTDPVILKAHYRVKHVDKGIDFAGLKILRCCDQCDIVGVIKGEKKFKGAHWHCYKCRNGFNRKDEAIKHYKTHFRNPQTTFQIQITQEVNQTLPQGYDSEDATATIHSEEFSVQSIHPVLTEAVTCMTADEHGFSPSLPVIQRSLDGASTMPGVGAVETVGVSDTQTIMIIQEDGSISALQDSCTSQDINTSSDGASNIVNNTNMDRSEEVDKLLERINVLEVDRRKKEKEITELRKKVQEQEEQIAEYKEREQDLLEQLNIPTEKNIQDLCEQLEAKHRELLQQQLTQLKRTFIQSNMIIVNSSLNNSLNQQMSLQTLNPTDSDGSHEDVRIHFQTSSNVTDTTVCVSDTQTNIESVIENDADSNHHMKCEIVSTQVEKEPDFEILQQEFTDSLDEDRLHIEDESIPVENDGQEPPLKRKKEK